MDNHDSIAEQKQQLRARMRQRRSALTPQEQQAAGEAVLAHFVHHPKLVTAPVVACYMPMRDELDVLPILRHHAAQHLATALPVITPEKTVLFRAWAAGDALCPHATLGVLEPLETGAIVVPTLILVPLLACDDRFYRLGYGGGYYDRTIAALRQNANPPLVIGVGYRFQKVAYIPTHAHDQPLDGLLTDAGVTLNR